MTLTVADFKLQKAYTEGTPLLTLAKASATVIEAGDMVALASGLAIKAVAASTEIAFSPSGAPAGETTVQVLVDRQASFIGTGAAVFAVANRGKVCDLSGTTNQLINSAAILTGVFKIDAGDDAGTVGSTANMVARIEKTLY
jgi:hypothetical protein